MANTHFTTTQQQQQQPCRAPFALRLRMPRRAAGGAAAGGSWRSVCVAALAASAAAAASAQHTGDARLESDASRRLVGFGAAAERLAHFAHQRKRSATAALAASSAVERETALAKQQQQHSTSSSSLTAAAAATSPSALRTKKLAAEYELQGVLGEGGFGRVHAARHRASNARVAVKRVFKAGTTRAKFLQEVAMLREAAGAGARVLQLREAFETADAYVLVTELVPGGELFEHLAAHGAFDERRARALTRELAAALAFLHARRVVHGDVKPENILLRSGGGGAQLIDFGQAFREDRAGERARAAGSGVGTTAYAAPELLGRREAGAPTDMWALGVVLYVLLCGRHPFDPANDASDDEIAARVRAGAFAQDAPEWRRASPAARDLVARLLALDPRARLTAEQVLAHEWLQ